MKENTNDPLKRVEDQLKKCVKCGACRTNCPAFSAFQREPAVARGKVALARHILDDDIDLDDQTYQAMSKCLLCGSCVEKCPNDVPTD
jgi:glycolate oxidase iron-sulfur subunit